MHRNSPDLLLNTRLAAKNIGTQMLPSSSLLIPPEYQASLEAEWNNIVVHKQNLGTKIWNCDLYRLESFAFREGSLQLEFATVQTKEVLVFCRHVKEHQYPEKYWPKNMFVASIVETSDAQCLFGELSGRTLGGKGKVDMLGGALSKREIELLSGADIERALFREFAEELSLTPAHIQSSIFRGLVLSEVKSIGIIFEVNLSIDSFQVLDLFNQGNDDELARLLMVKSSELSDFLAAGKSYFPTVGELWRLPTLTDK